MAFSQVVVLKRILDQVVEFNRRFPVEIRFQSHDQLPFGGAPAVLAHPGAFGDIEFTPVGGHLAARHGHEAFAIEFNLRLDAGELHQCGHQVLKGIETLYSFTCRNQARIADDGRYVQNRVINPMMVEVADMVLKGFTMVSIEHNDGIVQDAARCEGGKDSLHTGVQISKFAVILGNDIIFI